MRQSEIIIGAKAMVGNQIPEEVQAWVMERACGDVSELRALARVLRKARVDSEAGCWSFGCGHQQYGQTNIEGKTRLVSRLVGALVLGGVGQYQVCHTCGNKLCIKPEHLSLLPKKGRIRRNKGLGCGAPGRPRVKASVFSRLMARVVRDEVTGCWNYQGGQTKRGYGRLRIEDRYEGAHRVMAEMVYGDVEGFFVCHKCDNPACVNPVHLFVGTHMDNVRDSMAKGRRLEGEKHGGHKLTLPQVLEVRSNYFRRVKGIRQMAKELKVTQGTLYCVVRGKTWRHV